jgi:hypothetical protein
MIIGKCHGLEKRKSKSVKSEMIVNKSADLLIMMNFLFSFFSQTKLFKTLVHSSIIHYCCERVRSFC